MKLNELLAIAAIGANLGGPPINSAYRERRDKLEVERAKALAKKQRVRDEIRARRAALNKAGVK